MVCRSAFRTEDVYKFYAESMNGVEHLREFKKKAAP